MTLLLATKFLENGPMRSKNCIVVMCLRGGHQLSGARLLFATLLTEFEYFALSGRKFCIVFACLSRWEHWHSAARNSTWQLPAFLPTKDVAAFCDCSNDCIPEYRFISPVVWFGSSTFLRLPEHLELSSPNFQTWLDSASCCSIFRLILCGSSLIEFSRS